jgi:hypothetical protein
VPEAKVSVTLEVTVVDDVPQAVLNDFLKMTQEERIEAATGMLKETLGTEYVKVLSYAHEIKEE